MDGPSDIFSSLKSVVHPTSLTATLILVTIPFSMVTKRWGTMGPAVSSEKVGGMGE